MRRSTDRFHSNSIKPRRLQVESLESRLVLDSTVVFSEIMYNPGADQNLEWIELYNEMAVDMDISNWRIGGVGYTFPDGTVLPAQQFLVVAKSPDRFNAAYGVSTSFGPYSARLSNGGESIRLISNNERIMDEVDYRDSLPWPVAADGTGVSLAKVELDGGSSSATNWKPSAQIGGSPNAVNDVAKFDDAKIVFSELSKRGADDFFVELTNQADRTVALDGYSIVSAEAERSLPLSGTLTAGEFLSIDSAELPFSITDVERLFLYSQEGGRVEDAVNVIDSPQVRVLADSTEQWLTPDDPSPGAENSVALESDVVINEIFYHAPGTAIDDQQATFETTVLLPIDDNTTWRYRASAEGLATDWATRAHAAGEDGWESGSGLFGFERASLGIPMRTEFPNPATIFPGITTYYFETELLIEPDQLNADNGLALRHMVDDGAVFYINGQEFLRYNMPSGAIDNSTFASSIPNAVLSDASPIPTELLQVGSNLLSVEVHQASVASNDVVFGAELLQRRTVTEFVPGQPFMESEEEWVEIYNRSDTRTIDLSSWRLDDAVEFTFPEETTIGPGEFRLIAWDVDQLSEKYPNRQNLIIGEFTGGLSNSNETIKLLDRNGNLADEVHYFDGGRWPDYADGGGASLELVSPRADNSLPESWASSIESDDSAWQTIQYEEPLLPDGFSGSVASRYHEFILGLLDSGEVLIDDVSVLENGVGGIERIQNGSFENDVLGESADKWRIAGNHTGIVVLDPDDPSNQVLRLTASGSMEDRLNHAETTFVDNAALREGTIYRISFRARWENGSNQVNSHLYFDRLPKSTRLLRPANSGTPGLQNSNFRQNIGPGFEGLSHSPTIPAPDQPVVVAIQATDPDGVASVSLYFAVDDGNYQMIPMNRETGGRYSATIPGRASGDVVQFYVQAEDALGANSQFPAAGPDSRALYQIPNQNPQDGIHNLRIVMTPSETRSLHDRTNVMSNARTRATVIYNESEVFYDVGVRLKGSNAGRSDSAYLGFNVKFDPMQLFRGVHASIAIDRSGRSSPTPRTQDEILIKHIANKAGGIPHMYDDLVHVIAPRRSHTRSALLMMARYGDVFLDSQFEDGSDGTVFKLDIAYLPNGTTDRDPESPKIAFPYSHPQPTRDLEDLGDDKEAYRQHLLIRNNRARDDYSGIIAASKALDQPSERLLEATAETIDIDQWARAFALQSLTGAADAYTRGGLHHNVAFYVRPSDSRVIALPWDWDFAFTASTNQALVGTSGTAGRLMRQPTVRRLYHGHMLDIINTTFNNDYLDRWIDHYGTVAKQNLSPIKSYVRRRRDFVIRRLPDKVDFEISTNNGENFETELQQLQIRGQGWIDVREIRLGDGTESVPTRWIDDSTWEIDISAAAGENRLQLIALDHQGNVVGADSITVANIKLLGDLNDDGVRNVIDIDLLAAAVRNNEPVADINGDGEATVDDHTFLVQELLNAQYGDANLDGTFDSKDLVLIFQAAEYEDTDMENSTWAEGDWNGDGDFTTRDLVFAFQTGRYSG